jgi:hypothetical protein
MRAAGAVVAAHSGRRTSGLPKGLLDQGDVLEQLIRESSLAAQFLVFPK